MSTARPCLSGQGSRETTSSTPWGGFEEETDLQNLQEEAQSLTIINAMEEEQQKVVNLIALKTPKQEGDTKVPEDTNLQEEAQSLTSINARE